MLKERRADQERLQKFEKQGIVKKERRGSDMMRIFHELRKGRTRAAANTSTGRFSSRRATTMDTRSYVPDVISAMDGARPTTFCKGPNLLPQLPPAPLNTVGVLAEPETALARDISKELA